MNKYNVKIEFPGTGIKEQNEFSNAFKKGALQKIKLQPVGSSRNAGNSTEYRLEGNISLADLGGVISGALAKITSNYSFTILKEKQPAYGHKN